MRLEARQLGADQAVGRSSGLSAVVERPDRHLGLRARLRAFVARPSFRQSLLRAGFSLARQRVQAARIDLSQRFDKGPRIRSCRMGAVPLDRARSVAIFIHYAPVAAVSRMVMDQVQGYRDRGFAVVFVSMAPSIPSAAVSELEGRCAAIVERRNYGLDFGAWHDLLPAVLAQAPEATELLLVNDSLCGPFRSLEPAFAAMRAAPEGLYGLTENLAPAPHLQSYFLLATGRATIADLATFFAAHRVTANKRRTIREGEVRLSGWMRGRGHPVAAWCGYEAVEAAALRQPAARRRVRTLYPHLFAGIAPDDAAGMRAALRRRPLNSTHLFWRELVEEMGFPFVKTDLLLRNPLGIADDLDWRPLLEGDREAVAVIEEHLALLGGHRRASAARTAGTAPAGRAMAA
ncbi:rhamnan synthesis F family protein [Muricoccus aerilatus]|uniref:rhamnan synthesis F family protein n=1 Tax=Muricoccus aerilatus TaxID=452982 RepID=UPI000A89176F|nr:rhamnan synthesis F family protein [Roseomonas aerilata]